MGSSQKNVWVILDFFKAPPLVLLNINDLPDDIICNIFVYADDTTLYSKCDQVSDLWQWLKLASELKSNLRNTVDLLIIDWLDKMTCWFQCLKKSTGFVWLV